MQIIKIKPYFAEKMWGGDNLKKFGFKIPDHAKIGEAWIISALPSGLSHLDYQNNELDLKTFFENNRHLFGDYVGDFPLLVKIISANDYLSVQVHPNDEYALKHNHSLGKPESWYVLDAPKNAKLIYGHHAKTQSELEQLVNNGQWKKLLKEVSIQKGDFIYVDAGKIHALTPGVTVYELQRSSDVTYRFYDFDRINQNGKKRQLNLKDSLAVTSVPDSKDYLVRDASGFAFENDAFSLYVMKVKDETKSLKIKELNNPYWVQLSVVEGKGTINGEEFVLGESAIALQPLDDLEFTGEMTVLISWIRRKEKENE